MPYKNIHFIKIFLELFDDRRFIKECDDSQKLDYLLWIAMAGITANDADADPVWFKTRFNLEKDSEKIAQNLTHLSNIFPKLKIKRGKIKFDNFSSFHNYLGGIKEIPRKSKGLPRLDIDKKRIEKKINKESFKVIKAFEAINPDAKKFYGYANHLKASDSLIENYTLERVLNVIEKVLPKTNAMPYFPSITTPTQLQEKWSSLEAAITKHNNKAKADADKQGKVFW